MKTIVIYFSDKEPMGYPFNKGYYFDTYSQIIKDIENKGVDVFIVRADSYQGSGIFKFGWSLQDGELKKSDGEIKADLIFNRDDKNTIPQIHDCKIINVPELDNLCLDKWATAQMFPEFSPETDYVHSYEECMSVIEKRNLKNEDRVVLKKNFQTEGRGVFVIKSNEITKDLYDDWSDVLAQGFLDSEIGIPEVVEGVHDLRINVVNGEIINAYVRTPKPGTFLANVAQGGKGLSLTNDQISEEVIELVKKIQTKLKKFLPSVYSADFMNSSQGYKLIEMNSRPMVQSEKYFTDYKKFNSALVDMLVEEVNK